MNINTIILYYEELIRSFIQQILTNIPSIVALTIAVFGESFRKKYIKKSRLVVERATVNVQGTHGDETVYRLLIKNKGIYRATDVEVDVESIHDNGRLRKNFLPVPLGWTHARAMGVTVTRSIHPMQSVYLDVCHYLTKKELEWLKLCLKAGAEVQNYSNLNPGSSVLILRIYQDSGQTQTIKVRINWEQGNKPTMKLVKTKSI